MTCSEVNGLKSDDWASAGIEIEISNVNNMPEHGRFIFMFITAL
jgi:uncharacterized protein (UPF0147 family)